MGDSGSTTGAGSAAPGFAGDAQDHGQELLPAVLVLPLVWRHLVAYGPPVDLRTALAAACACRASRLELRATVTRARLERPSQGLLESVCHAFPLLKDLEVDCGQCSAAAAAASTSRRLYGQNGSYDRGWHDGFSGGRAEQQQQQQQGDADVVTSPTDWGEDSQSLSGEDDDDSSSGEPDEGTRWARRDSFDLFIKPVVWRLDFEDMRSPARAPPRRSPRSRRQTAFYYDTCDDSDSDAGGEHWYSTSVRLTWPALERLHLRDADMGQPYTRLPSRHSAPRLRRLVLQDSVLPDQEYHALRLPERLRSLHLHEVDVEGIGALQNILSNHAHLRVISATQINRSGFPTPRFELRLLRCEQLRLGWDGLTHLRVWAPRLRRLDLSACRDLRSLRLLQQEPQRCRYGNQQAGGLPAAMGALALAPALGAPRVAEAAASSALAAGPPGQASAGGSSSSSSSSAPPVPQPPAVWVDLSGTQASRYTLKQLRTHPRVGPERLVPPRWYGTGRSSSMCPHMYDSNGRLPQFGFRGDWGSSNEDDDNMSDPGEWNHRYWE